jgi:hypothetical protein
MGYSCLKLSLQQNWLPSTRSSASRADRAREERGFIATTILNMCHYSYEPVSSISPGLWDVWLIGITIVALIVATAVFFMGQRAIRNSMSDAELIAEVTR